MALTASTTLPFGVDRVTETFVNEDFLRHTSELVGGTLTSVTRQGELNGEFVITVVRTLPTTRLPEIAKKFVGESLTVTQTESWSAPAADGSRQANISLKVAGAPVDVSAVQKLVAEGTGTRIDLDGKVSSSIPFLGSKTASAAEPMVAKGLKLQASQAQAWLESH
ncbi:DUF2505 domain-containing protein [Pseudarthrobacter sp. J1763]|uniref:DUF2505 domain-containing protein n=1 Tax=Pseudarthrobacter sp. J1763 TaxID=3420445 RepID=UPI003D2C982A